MNFINAKLLVSKNTKNFILSKARVLFVFLVLSYKANTSKAFLFHFSVCPQILA